MKKKYEIKKLNFTTDFLMRKQCWKCMDIQVDFKFADGTPFDKLVKE